MKRIFLLAAMLLSLTAGRAEWLETVHDFGAFNEDDGKVRTTFMFVNDGDAPVTIERVRTTCGCTVPEYSTSKVAKGDTVRVTAVYNPSGRPGRFTKNLIAYLSNGSQQRLQIKGVVIGAQNTLRSRYPITVGPVRLKSDMVPFGTVNYGRLKAEFLSVYNASKEPVVPSWSGLPSYLNITAAHDTIPPGEQGVYSFTLSPGKDVPYGLLADSVALNVPGADPYKVEITAIVEENFSAWTDKQWAKSGRIAIDNNLLDYGEFPAGSPEPITREFRIRNTGESELIIRRIYTTDRGFTIKLPKKLKIKPGKEARVEVSFNPSEFSSELLNARLQVIVNDPTHAISTVRMVGIPQ